MKSFFFEIFGINEALKYDDFLILLNILKDKE